MMLEISLLQKQRRNDTASPWVEVVMEERTSYTYSKLDPVSGLIANRRKCTPNIGTRINTALADFRVMAFFLLKLFSKMSLDLRTLITLQRKKMLMRMTMMTGTAKKIMQCPWFIQQSWFS